MNLKYFPRALDLSGIALFGYLGITSAIVLLKEGVDSRVLYEIWPFFQIAIVPHAFKVLMWSGVALVLFRKEFGWKWPFVPLMAYGAAEVFSSSIFMGVHELGNVSYWVIWFPPYSNYIVEYAGFAFVSIVGYLVIRPRFKRDWSLMPFVVFVIAWAFMGYQTEVSTFATIQQETFEFIWNGLYLLAVTGVVRR